MMPREQWERDVTHNQRMRANSVTPYVEMARWRRRFWILLVVAIGLALIVAAESLTLHSELKTTSAEKGT